MSLKAVFKGWLGEVQGTLAHKLFLDTKVYRGLNDVTLANSDGTTTQIDHVIVSPYGIFVVESKNFSGWIFGREQDAQWTQSLYGKKSRFQNPLRQNYRHIKTLMEFLSLPEAMFHSVVMFWGGCEFKTPLPDNVLASGYVSYIKSKTDVLFEEDEVEQIVDALKTGRLPRTWGTRRAHVAALKERHAAASVCPRCGDTLVLRTARSGANAGSSFYGCSRFPQCRYTKTDSVE